VQDEPAALTLLADALTDERLVNIDARAYFEWRVACLLVNGWRPGHEFLFKPACDAFNWEQDRRRLGVYGQVGATIDAAIRERLTFFGLPVKEFEALRNMIRRLRKSPDADAHDLRYEIPMLQLLTQRYPHWLNIIAPRDNVNARFERWKALPEGKRKAVPDMRTPAFQPPAAKSSGGNTVWWFAILGLVVLIRLVVFATEPKPDRHRPFTTTPAMVDASPPDRARTEADLPKRQREAEAALQRALGATPATANGKTARPTTRAAFEADHRRREAEATAALRRVLDVRTGGVAPSTR